MKAYAGMKLAFVSPLLYGSLLAQTVAIQDVSDPSRARISGVVLNERAQPVKGVTVEAMPPGPVGAVLPHTETDKKGKFSLAGLIPGHTYVSAFNQEAFYPNADFGGIWDRSSVAEVELPVGDEVSNIVLTVKAVARLELRAKDAVTGAVIPYPAVILKLPGAPNSAFGGSTLLNWWLAPTAPVYVCVTADHYGVTFYDGHGASDVPVPITFKPRQVVKAMLPLKPTSGPSYCFPKQTQ